MSDVHGADPMGQARSARAGWIRFLPAALAALWVAGCATGARAPSSTPSTPTPAAVAGTTRDADFAASALQAAATLMAQADNADVAKQNSHDEATAIGSIYDRVIVHQTFDQRLLTISFPSAAVADARAVLNADAALEGTFGKLAASWSRVNDYNPVFGAMVSLQTTFNGALTALAHDLGVTLRY